MKFKLAIGNTVQVPVRVKCNDGGAERVFEFRLACQRLTAEELKARMENQTVTTADIIREVAKGWDGQQLVVLESGEPAPFGPEALDCMLGLAHMPLQLLNAYTRECGAREKN